MGDWLSPGLTTDEERRFAEEAEWRDCGLSSRARRRLAHLKCYTIEDVRRVGQEEIRCLNIGNKTIAEIGKKLFNDEWPTRKSLLQRTHDDKLIAEIESRGYLVMKKSE